MKMFRLMYGIVLAAALNLVLVKPANAAEPRIMQTPSGVRFGILGDKPTAPAPTLFNFASTSEITLGNPTYSGVSDIALQHGYICVSLDLPFHPGDQLRGWAAATKRGEAWLPPFLTRASQVLDYLIQEGYTDPKRVAACGTSRGGFIATHFAAVDSRVRCVLGFVPVTDLGQLTEFAKIKKSAAVKSMAIVNLTGKLVGRPLWVCIGNNDGRVNTDSAIQFTRAMVAATRSARAAADADEAIDIELHVMPWPGHGGDGVVGYHDEAAAWLLARLGEGGKER